MTNCYIKYESYRDPNFVHPLFDENRWNLRGKTFFNGELSPFVNVQNVVDERFNTHELAFRPSTFTGTCPPSWLRKEGENEKDFWKCYRDKTDQYFTRAEVKYIEGDKSRFNFRDGTYTGPNKYKYVNQ